MNSTEATQTVGSAGVVTRRRANSDVVRPYAVGWAVLTAVVGLQWLLPNPYSFYSWIVETGSVNSNVPQAPATWALVLIFWVKVLVVVASASAPLVARKNLWVATTLGSVGFIALLDSWVRASDATTLCALVGVAFVSILLWRRLAWFPAVLALVGPLAMSWSAGRIHLTILGFDNQSEYWGAVQRVVMPLLWVVAVASILGLAQVVRTRAQQAAVADLLEDRSSRLGREAVVLDERARLARDLHDVVAHRVSLIAVRAESAPFAHPDLGPDAQRLLAETADDARAALDELREVLGVLHRTTERAPRTPQPGVGQIQALVDEARAAGAAVEVGGAIGEVSDTTGTTAYRVVQEALTNARRHAPEETATITFGGDDDLVIRIVNATGAPDTDVAPGRGLTGMRERVELAGGRLEVSREGKWFVVEARLPPGDAVTKLVRVIVADDQPVIRDGIAAVLDAQDDIEVIGRASNGQDLIDLIDIGSVPDVALVDIRMPGVDGIEACRRIAGRAAVLILTTFDLDDYVTDALQAGASGFLLKDVPAARLVEAVRLVADGSMLLGPNVTRRLVEDLAARPARPVDLAALGLTQREQDVFGQLARGRSNAEIATALVVTPETVKSHVAEVLRKLQLRDRVQVVVFAHERGLVQPD